MNKKKKIFIVIILLLIIVLIPIPYSYFDGGTKEYKAILYQVSKIHRLNSESTTGYEDGWIIKVFGMQLYNSVKVVIDVDKISENRNKVMECLDNELMAHIVSEKNTIKEISLNEISHYPYKIDAFIGNVSNTNGEYFIIFPKNGTFISDVMKEFELHFSNKYDIYQQKEVGNSGIVVYFHNELNDLDFKKLENKCILRENNSENMEKIPNKTLNNLRDGTKIVIKSDSKILGTIDNQEVIKDIYSRISSSYQSTNSVFLSDSPFFNLEFYDKNGLIDVIYVWHDGSRILPKSIRNENGYFNLQNNDDLRKIIEESTDYVFYQIINYSDNCDGLQTEIFDDGNNKYYLNCDNPDNIFTDFLLDNKRMKLKYALINNYIDASKVAEDYQDILIKK